MTHSDEEDCAPSTVSCGGDDGGRREEEEAKAELLAIIEPQPLTHFFPLVHSGWYLHDHTSDFACLLLYKLFFEPGILLCLLFSPW